MKRRPRHAGLLQAPYDKAGLSENCARRRLASYLLIVVMAEKLKFFFRIAI